MINHLRTLLLNQDADSAPGALFPGEQVVHPGFRAQRLPGPLQSVHQLLFGSGADRATMNMRLQELLTCVHASGFAEYAEALDPRITYWPFNSSLMERFLLGASARKIAGGSQALYFSGLRTTTESVNRIYFQWQLDVVDAANVRITEYNDASDVVETSLLGYTVSAGLSSLIEMPGSMLQVRFEDGVGSSWLLDVLARPSRDFVSLIEDVDGSLNSTLQNELWPDNAGEPYTTFRNLWQTHDQLPFRVAGLTLALGYRLDELSR